MKVFVVGATGATGKLLVQQLLTDGHQVTAIVRTPEALVAKVGQHKALTLAQGTILEMSDEQVSELVDGCESIALCLGHNISFKGLFGKPRRLVRNTVKKLCDAVEDNGQKIKLVLMNTSGNRNDDLNEKVSMAQRTVLFLLRHFLPPHADNEEAADHLRSNIGQRHPQIEWVVVRPDGLIDTNEIGPYENHPSPIRSAIFDSGKVSRINVAHFMACLVGDKRLWETWKGQMPLIYDKEETV